MSTIEILDFRHYEEELILNAKLVKKKKSPLPINLIVKFRKTSDSLFITSYSGKTSVQIQISEEEKKIIFPWIISGSYIAGIISSDNQSALIKVLHYREDKYIDLECAYTEEFAEQLQTRRITAEISSAPLALKELCSKKVSMDTSCYIMGVRSMPSSQKEQQEPDVVIVCSQTNGYLTLFHQTISGQSALVCTGMTRKEPKGSYRYFLTFGNIAFLDMARTKDTFSSAVSIVQSVLEDTKSFFNLWNRYGGKELEQQLELFISTGIHPCIVESDAGKLGIRFQNPDKIYRIFKKMRKNRQDITSWMLWNESIDDVMYELREHLNSDEDDKHKNAIDTIEAKRKSDGVRVFNIQFDENAFSLDSFQVNNFIPLEQTRELSVKAGNVYYLTFNIVGYMTIYQRRIHARDRIASGKNRMLALPLILEDKYEGYFKEPRDIEGLTETIEREVFGKYHPTPTQRKAVEIALHTPDIAIIQGPPGTGKTTVITAIVQRLAELDDSESELFSRNLISAFQHDAVTNAIERIHNFGLPAIKIGEKSTGIDDRRLISLTIENWIFTQQNKVLHQNSDILKFANSQKFDENYYTYLNSSNSISATVNVLRIALDALTEIEERGSEIGQKTARLLEYFESQKQKSEDTAVTRSIIATLERLPISPVIYTDDGERCIKRAVAMLRTYGSRFEEEIAFLEKFPSQSENERD